MKERNFAASLNFSAINFLGTLGNVFPNVNDCLGNNECCIQTVWCIISHLLKTWQKNRWSRINKPRSKSAFFSTSPSCWKNDSKRRRRGRRMLAPTKSNWARRSESFCTLKGSSEQYTQNVSGSWAVRFSKICSLASNISSSKSPRGFVTALDFCPRNIFNYNFANFYLNNCTSLLNPRERKTFLWNPTLMNKPEELVSLVGYGLLRSEHAFKVAP